MPVRKTTSAHHRGTYDHGIQSDVSVLNIETNGQNITVFHYIIFTFQSQ